MIASRLIHATRALFLGLAAAFACTLATAPASGTPGMLSIDDGTPVRIASPAALRRAVRRCSGRGGCATILVETCDRCDLSAEAHGGGYALTSRLGPPGPDYDLFDNRPGRGRRRIFALSDVIEILTGYLFGRRPRYVSVIRIEDQ